MADFDLYAFTTGGFGSTQGLLDMDKTRLGTEFFNACRLGNLEEAQQLLAKGAEIDVERTDHTPLFIATQNRHVNIALWLLENGAEANCRNAFGWSGLHQAIAINEIDLVKAYLDNGALVSRQPQRSGETPLMTACKEGNEEIALLLLAKGANVKAQDKKGNSPLHYAAANGEPNICKELLDRGAWVLAVNHEGNNCAQVAANDMVRAQLEAHSLLEDIKGPVAQAEEPKEAPAPVKRRILKA